MTDNITTHGRRARSTSGARLWAWSPPGRCCGSGRRSAAGVGVRRASRPWLRTWTGSPPRPRSRACAEVDPRCKQSAGPEERPGPGQRSLRRGAAVGLGSSYTWANLRIFFLSLNLIYWNFFYACFNKINIVKVSLWALCFFPSVFFTNQTINLNSGENNQ